MNHLLSYTVVTVTKSKCLELNRSHDLATREIPGDIEVTIRREGAADVSPV